MTGTLYVSAAPQVVGLDHTTQNLLDRAWKQWAAKLPRNFERLVYFDGKNKLKDLQIAIPPQLRDRLDVVSGWPEKAVTEPSNRTVWETMYGVDGQEDPLDLASLLYLNRFRVELHQATRAAMTYSAAFQSTTPGDVQSGEPEVMMMFHSALHATGLWDRRRRALSMGLLINAVDPLGQPTQITIMLPFETIICQKGPRGWIVTSVIPSPIGRVPLELYPMAPDLDRPFGRARIDRRVMSITDRAVRGGSRLDVHSEMFSAMKLFLLGADESAFRDEHGNTVPLWTWYLGRFNAINRDEEGELPKIEKLAAESPEPHIATMRQLASEFSGHTGVPLGSLGIAQDQPESADAKNVAREDIIFMVEQQHAVFGHAMRRTFENAVMIRDRLSEPPTEVALMDLAWRRPDRASEAALADAGAKQVAAAQLEGTSVGMKMIGMRPAYIREAESERRRKGIAEIADRIRQNPAPTAAPAADAAPVPDTAALDEQLKQAQVAAARASALGGFRRAGVTGQKAAELAGIDGTVDFIPGEPITIRSGEE